MRNEGPTLWYE
jgi:hypothetical protein